MLAGPSAAQLVIPATAGGDACTQSGLTTKQESLILNTGSITDNQVIVRTAGMTAASLAKGAGYDLHLEILENKGTGQRISKSVKLGRIADSTSSIDESTESFNDLKKNTRYVAVIHNGLLESTALLESQVISRRCFKTSGTFTNAEQNLKPDGTADISQGGPGFGCFAIARTWQDRQECLCWGTRGGNQFITNTISREGLGCGDSS